MARWHPVTNEGARHPLRRILPPPMDWDMPEPRSARENVAFFLISFTSAFIILYGFIV